MAEAVEYGEEAGKLVGEYQRINRGAVETVGALLGLRRNLSGESPQETVEHIVNDAYRLAHKAIHANLSTARRVNGYFASVLFVLGHRAEIERISREAYASLDAVANQAMIALEYQSQKQITKGKMSLDKADQLFYDAATQIADSTPSKSHLDSYRAKIGAAIIEQALYNRYHSLVPVKKQKRKAAAIWDDDKIRSMAAKYGLDANAIEQLGADARGRFIEDLRFDDYLNKPLAETTAKIFQEHLVGIRIDLRNMRNRSSPE